MLFLLGSLMLLFNCSVTKGQGCRTVLQPEFSVYQSSSGDGYNIYTSVSIQGYANIAPGPGCNMSAATHHVGAENKLNNVDHWTYSANGCPTCYFSATNTESIVGVPGVVYSWISDGQAICSIVGSFWNSSGGGGIPGCLVPSTETTADEGFSGAISRELFQQTLSDTAVDSFDNHLVQEYTVTPGTNGCWWSTSGLVQNPGTQNSHWTVGQYSGVSGYHNQWGPDEIGWDLVDLDNIVQNGSAHGIIFPCVTTIYQGMQIECSANVWFNYRTDTLTITVDDDHTVKACRAGVCSEWVDFSYRIGGKTETQWVRIFRLDSGGSPRSSPQSVPSVREVR
jgi:hypothetical protein